MQPPDFANFGYSEQPTESGIVGEVSKLGVTNVLAVQRLQDLEPQLAHCCSQTSSACKSLNKDAIRKICDRCLHSVNALCCRGACPSHSAYGMLQMSNISGRHHQAIADHACVGPRCLVGGCGSRAFHQPILSSCML